MPFRIHLYDTLLIFRLKYEFLQIKPNKHWISIYVISNTWSQGSRLGMPLLSLIWHCNQILTGHRWLLNGYLSFGCSVHHMGCWKLQILWAGKLNPKPTQSLSSSHIAVLCFLEPRREQAPSFHPFLALIQVLFGVRLFLVIPNWWGYLISHRDQGAPLGKKITIRSSGTVKPFYSIFGPLLILL